MKQFSGVCAAVVIDNVDPDNSGRVKVRLGQSSGAGEKGSEIWARIATLMAGNNRGTWFMPDVKDEVLVASIGANAIGKREVSDHLIRRMDLIVTDDVPAAKADSGDLIAACQSRLARWDDILPLEKIVADGVTQPRPKRIFFQSTGIADEDLAVGRYVLEQAKKKKLKMKRVTEI